MTRYLSRVALPCLLSACAALSAPAQAALPSGARAPDFQLPATLGGEVFEFSLSEALRKGPVVLYFYPAAFTKGCTIEAHDFAEATEDYRRHGATVLGVSADQLEILKEFSVSACRSKFAVAADPEARVISAYDARMAYSPDKADRISYVITPDGRIYDEYSSRNPEGHVQHTLDAVKRWAAAQGR